MFSLIIATATATLAAGQVVEPNAAIDVTAITNVTTAGDNIKPFVAVRPQGGAYLAWARKDGSRTTVLFAKSRDGERFDDPVAISTEGMDLDLGAESGPNVTVAPTGTIYVVWASGSWSASAAQPSSAATRAAPAKGPNPEPSKSAGHAGHSGKGAPARPGNLNIYLTRSNDDGRTFSKPIQINDDRDGPEHRFPTVAVDQRGTVIVAWLDKRPRDSAVNSCRVFASWSNDGGANFSPNIDVTQGQNNAICHCCRVAMVTHPNLGPALAFRNDIDDHRDMFFVHSKDVTAGFSKPAAMEDTGWYVPMCPMNGPSLTLDEAARIHSIWVTGADLDAQPLISGSSGGYKLLYSHFDEGKNCWESPLYVADGEHARLAASENVVQVAWDSSGIVWLATLPQHGSPAPKAIPLSRAGSFPSLAATDQRHELFVTWQERGDDSSNQIRIARIACGSDTALTRQTVEENTKDMIRFSKEDLGKVPAGWTAAQTGKGEGSVWKVVEDASAPSKTSLVLAQTAESPNSMFNLCVVNESSYKDLELSVAFKAIKGKLDQGGGVVWRYRDPNNYYVARMNPLEDNFRVYKVQDGKRTQFASADVEVAAGEWHVIKIDQRGDHILCSLDGKQYLDVTDSTFTESGKIGLWSKADSQSYFDDFKVERR